MQKGPYSSITLQPVAQQVTKSIAQLSVQPVKVTTIAKPVVASLPTSKPVVASLPAFKPVVASLPVSKPNGVIPIISPLGWVSNINQADVKPWTFADLFKSSVQPKPTVVKPLSAKISKFESEPFSETTEFAFNLLYYTLMFIMWVLIALVLNHFIIKSSKQKYKEQMVKHKELTPQSTNQVGHV